MEISDWILIGAVVVSLVIGVRSLRQTKKIQEKQYRHTEEIQQREHRQRLLNEIIEWAIDVAKCEGTVYIQEPSPIISKLSEKHFEYELEDKKRLVQGIMQDHRRVWQSRYMNLHSNYQILDTRGEYILNLSETKYFDSILNNVKRVKAQIYDYLETLRKYMEDMDDKLQQERVIEQGKELNKRAIQLIKEATKIKIKDIG